MALNLEKHRNYQHTWRGEVAQDMRIHCVFCPHLATTCGHAPGFGWVLPHCDTCHPKATAQGLPVTWSIL